VSVSNLENADAIQLTLPFKRRANAAIDAVLDQLRDRFGSNAVVRASLLGRDQGMTMPLLPD
jgi:DNA polymerase-4